MSEKRKAHAKFIEMRNNGKKKTKKLRPLGEDENPIVVGNKAEDDAKMMPAMMTILTMTMLTTTTTTTTTRILTSE